jgi:plasmid stabilization system protein ParE
MPDQYRVIILPRAIDDLIEICTFIENRSPQNAALVAERVIAAADSLEVFPHRFKLHQHRTDAALTVRSMSSDVITVPVPVISKRITGTGTVILSGL